MLDMNAEAATGHAETLENNARAFACNVTDGGSIAAAIEGVIETFGGIDILVNSAGIVDLAPAEDLSDAAWRRTIDLLKSRL